MGTQQEKEAAGTFLVGKAEASRENEYVLNLERETGRLVLPSQQNKYKI
jgi:hypothetical protein